MRRLVCVFWWRFLCYLSNDETELMGRVLALCCLEPAAEEPRASADAAQVTPVKKVVAATKSVVKRTSARTKTPTSKKTATVRTPDSVEAKVAESQKKEDLDCLGKVETSMDNIGEPEMNEETAAKVGESAGDKAADSEREGTAMEVEEAVIVISGESAKNEQIIAVEDEHTCAFAIKEERATGTQMAPIVNVGDSSKQEDPLVGRVEKSVENEEAEGTKEGEEVVEEKEEETGDFGNEEEPNLEPLNIEETVVEDFRGEDTQTAKEFGSGDIVEDYGDRVDLGEHGEEELAEDDQEEPAEDDPQEPAEDTEALEEECRELTAVAKERKIKKEHEIFVGGLDRDAEEEDVRKVFERIGEVVEVRLHKDPSTNKNKGYAFVMFANKEHAKQALSEMKNPVVCNYS